LPYLRRWPFASAAALATAIALGLLAGRTSLLQPHELRLDRALQTHTRSPALTPAMKAIGAAASPVRSTAVLAVWVGWLLMRRRPVAALSTLLVVCAGGISAELTKLIVVRDRPPADFVLEPEFGSDSFPSTHVSFTFSVATAAYFLVRGTRRQRPVAVAGTTAVALVAFDRLYLGVHYPTDLIGSVLVSGAAITCVTGIWHHWLLPRLTPIPPPPAPAPAPR
jgi:membrane-associated phospholipid phosphatase